MIWKLHLPPKIRTFCWKFLHNGLPLGANLVSRGLNMDGLCTFGCHNEETMDHLFLHCPIVRAVWFGSKLNLRSDQIPNLFNWINSLIKAYDPKCHDSTSNYIADIAIWICWCIYHQRNDSLHNNPVQPH